MAANSAIELLLRGSLAALAQTAGGVLCNSLTSFLKKASDRGWHVALAGLASAGFATAAPVLVTVSVMGGAAALQELLKRRKDRELTEKLATLDTQNRTALEMLRPILESVTALTQREPVYTAERVEGWVKAAHGQDLEALETAFVNDVAALLEGAGLATETHLNEACDLLTGVWVVVNDSNERIRLIERAVRDLQSSECETPSPPRPSDNFLEAGIVLNQNFLGRDRELEQLHTRLEQGNVAIVHALTGEGGVGKTELAKAYVLSRADDYDGRWWLDASEEAVESSTVAALEAVTGIPIAPQATPDQIRSALCRALSEGKHLLILDNVENPKRLEAFQLRPPSRVLATTKRTDLPAALVTPFEVEVLDPDDAVALLRKHREDLSGPEHEKALGSVVEFLGCHTLAVALAGEYLRKFPNVTTRELLTRLEEDEVGAEGFTLEEIQSDKLGTSYRKNVAASLGLHLPEFDGTPAMDLLGLAAFCHPTAIPVDLLCAAVKLEQREVERWLANLRDVSIIGYNKTVSIHRLTQSLIRHRMGKAGQREALGGLIGALMPKFEDSLDHHNWPSQDAYASHALAALPHAERLGPINDAGFVANQVGLYLQGRVRFDEALETFRLAELNDRAAFGDEHPNVAIRVNNIGSVLEAKGDLGGAMQKYREAERIIRAAFGDDHPKVTASVNNIGSVLKAKGDLGGALEKFREAERIDRAAFGDDHPNVAIRVNNIGSVLYVKGDLGGAMQKYREAERINRAAFGDDHPNVAPGVNNIGLVLSAQGDFAGALEKFREAERIDRAAFGDDHPKVAIRVNNIGSVLKAQGHLDGALQKYREAERIDRAAFGDEHPMVAIRVNNIGSALQDKGDLDGALQKYREAERIDRFAFGDDHPTVATHVSNVGSVLLAQGDPKGAGECATASFRILLRAHGPRGQNTVTAAQNLLALDIDPIAIAREVVGDGAATELAAVLSHE